ncbi:MAG: STAS domain-containing protein [Oribacterium sp.]|nr:STAS domain-containing protein [Oribacterium sp.]
MTINEDKNGDELTISLEGKLDAFTAPELQSELEDSLEGINKVILDFSKLVYLSSAGIRVLFWLKKRLNKQGKMIVRNASDRIKEIISGVGFSEILEV